MIYNKNISEIAKLLADKKDPVPAGGTTVSINGLLGVSLLKLVFDVSCKNMSKNNNLLNELNQAQDSFLNLMNQDIIVFKKNAENNFNNKEELKNIIEIPLNIAETSFHILKLGKENKNYVKNNVIADYKIACKNLEISIKGALDIIESNYNFFDQSNKYLKDVKNTVKNLKKI